MVGRGRRKYLQGERIVSFKRFTIMFAGEQLDQGDLDVFIHSIHLTAIETRKHNRRPDGLVHFSVRGFLGAIGRRPGKSGQLWLLHCLRRLSSANIQIRLEGIPVYCLDRVFDGPLINVYFYDPRQRHYYLRLNSSLGALFELGWTQLSWKERLQLPGELARWLHGLYSSTQAYPLKVVSLQTLSGSNYKRLSDFRRHLKKALGELQQTGLLGSWNIDSEDKIHVIWQPEKREKAWHRGLNAMAVRS